MPTITLQVGQCGNQLGSTLWDLLQQQQAHSGSSSLVSQEWFGRVSRGTSCLDSGGGTALLRPRCICIDSEAKVVKHWEGQQHQAHAAPAAPTVHMLGKGGGCGNNWSCGYSLAFSNNTTANTPCSWSASDDQLRCVDQVLEGVRREAEREAGVPDFLLLSSLAGGTGSGFGSALLETLADEHPLSTLAAVAVAPGRAGGSDTATQSINCCLALRHLSQHAHAVLLCDNQVLLDQLNNNNNNSTTAAGGSSSRAGSASRRGPSGAVSGRACLQGVNELAAQALLGLLWPLGEADQLARRTNIRQLASTVAADPQHKFLEVCHVSQPDAQLPVNMMGDPWPARLKLLARQLPAYDPFHPTQPVSTSAMFLVARGGLCTQPSQGPNSRPAATRGAGMRAGGSAATSQQGGGRARTPSSSSSAAAAAAAAAAARSIGGFQHNNSCWVSAGGLGGVVAGAGNTGSNSGRGSSSSSWCAEAALGAVSSSWPRWAGGSWEAHVGDSALLLWDAAAGKATASLSAAVRRSSTGSFLRDVAVKCTRLCDAGAYMHWYQQYGTQPEEIKEAAAALEDLADSY